MKLYVKVSEDDLELPEAVAETMVELSRMLRKDDSYACQTIKYAKKNGTKPKIIEVEIDKDEISNDRRNGAERSRKGA